MERPKTKFEEFLAMERKQLDVSAEEDLELERKLAKRLKVKGGKLRGEDDGLEMLLPDISTDIQEEEEEEEEVTVDAKKKNRSSKNKKKRRSKAPEQEKEENTVVVGSVVTDAVVPEADSTLVKSNDDMGTDEALSTLPIKRSGAGNEPEEHTRIRRQVKGLLNRLSESNVQSITAKIASIFQLIENDKFDSMDFFLQSQSISRSVSSKIISDEVLASCSSGGNEQNAADLAAFVAGMASSVGIDFGAKLMAALAKSFEDEYSKEGNISLRNLTLLLSYLYTSGVCSCDLIYDFLIMLSKRLTEIDVSTILTVLQCCWMKLRRDDPAAMMNFIRTVEDRVKELKDIEEVHGKRMEYMLKDIDDIKTNKKRSSKDPVQYTSNKKWLQEIRVGDISIRGLTWSKLLDPNKKGQWWLSGDIVVTSNNTEEVATTIDKEVVKTQEMLQLAISQGMNTKARQAIFIIIMWGEDYEDAFEKLIRLDLPGRQDREIARVLVHCCLYEKVFNKYYTLLATKLCEYDKNHKFSLQYCLWDHFRDIDTVEFVQSFNLAKFVAEMIASFTISIAVLKTVDLSDVQSLTPKRIMHFRTLFDTIFSYSDDKIWNIFTRAAVLPELEELRTGITFFCTEYVVKRNRAVSGKFKIAKKALENSEGVLK